MVSDRPDTHHPTSSHGHAPSRRARKVEPSRSPCDRASCPEGSALLAIIEQLTSTVSELQTKVDQNHALVGDLMKALLSDPPRMMFDESGMRQAARRLSVTRIDGPHQGETRVVDWSSVYYFALPNVKPTPGKERKRSPKVFSQRVQSSEFASERPFARTAEGLFLVQYRTLEDVERHAPVQFLRIGQSLLVNLDAVDTDFIRGQGKRGGLLRMNVGSTTVSAEPEELVIGELALDSVRWHLGHADSKYPNKLEEMDQSLFGSLAGADARLAAKTAHAADADGDADGVEGGAAGASNAPNDAGAGPARTDDPGEGDE